MLTLQIISRSHYLAQDVADALVIKGYQKPVVRVDKDTTETRFVLKYGPETSHETLSQFCKDIQPLQPLLEKDVTLPSNQMCLQLLDASPFNLWNIMVNTEDLSFAQFLCDCVGQLGFEQPEHRLGRPKLDVIKFGGASPLVRQSLRWLFARQGITLKEEKVWNDQEVDVWISARDPNFLGEKLKSSAEIILEGDDLSWLFKLQEQLKVHGYDQVSVRSQADHEYTSPKLFAGQLSRDPQILHQFKEILNEEVSKEGISTDEYPFKIEYEESQVARVSLPIRALKTGKVRPTGGHKPARWSVNLLVEDGKQGDHVADIITNSFLEAGFIDVTRGTFEETPLAVEIDWGSAEKVSSVKERLIRDLLEQCYEQFNIRPHIFEQVTKRTGEDSIEVRLSKTLFNADVYKNRVSQACAGIRLSVQGESINYDDSLLQALRNLGFAEVRVDSHIEESSVSHPTLYYESQLTATLTVISGEISELLGTPCELEYDHYETGVDHSSYESLFDQSISDQSSEGMSDIDFDLLEQLTLRLPDSMNIGLIHTEDRWFSREPVRRALTPWLDVKADHISFGALILPRRKDSIHPRTPHPSTFDHYCIDQPTADTLSHIAESIYLREPCLLEGETGTSKTSAILFLAQLLNQPIIRMNLSGQTDVGELIGRFVPNTETDDNQGPWRWQNGAVIEAIEQGYWLILDEINLAEPQILERINPLLEKSPSITLNEYDQRHYGPNGLPIHSSFRIFGTMNPSSYAGRAPLSPAYLDRWRGYKRVALPSADDERSLLKALILGEVPVVKLRGINYEGYVPDVSPYSSLAQTSSIYRIIDILADAHSTLSQSNAVSGGALNIRPKYIYTRRTLLSVLELLSSSIYSDIGTNEPSILGALEPQLELRFRIAIHRYYLAKTESSPDEQAKVRRIFENAGLLFGDL